ncbi:MAG TPA: MmcQ/YjbR family DNA-binding protein [Jatrophihabitans sp.]|jgi:hypothetical protein
MADPVERLRTLCLALPEVVEHVSHGEAAFFVRGKKQFACVDDHHHGAEHLGFWCAAPPGAQEAWVADDPERYFRPPYVGHRGWLGVTLDNEPNWDEVAEIVRDAYCQIAPKTLVARLGAGPS